MGAERPQYGISLNEQMVLAAGASAGRVRDLRFGWKDGKTLLHGGDFSTVVRHFKGGRVGTLRGVGVRDLVSSVGRSVSVVPAVR